MIQIDEWEVCGSLQRPVQIFSTNNVVIAMKT